MGTVGVLLMATVVSSVVTPTTCAQDLIDKRDPKENSLEWFFVKSDRKNEDGDPFMIDPNDFNRIQPIKKYINPHIRETVSGRTPVPVPLSLNSTRGYRHRASTSPPEDNEDDSGSGWMVDDEPEAQDVITGSGQRTDSGFSFACDENRCKYGGVCDPRADDFRCVCNLSCLHEGQAARSLVCGSDRRIYRSHCEMKVQSCDTQTHITSAPFQLCTGSSFNSNLPRCHEKVKHETYWSPWSIWMRSGNKDFRIRHCERDTAPGSKGRFCSGRLVETRACPEVNGKLCRSRNGSVDYQKLYKCRGVDVMDIGGADKLYLGAINYDDCWFSLVDTKTSDYKYRRWSHVKLLTRASYREWCQNRKRFVPFISSPQHCSETLNHYCHIAAKCKYRYGRERQKPDDMSRACWKRFTVAGRLPSGIATLKGTALLCQRFSRRAQLSTVYGDHDVYFVTMYDTRHRIPTYSLAVLESISDVGSPVVPPLIERGLINGGRFVSWLFSSPENGLLFESEVERDLKGNTCHLGENQALESDYRHSGMRPGALITAQLVGCSPAAKISTRAFTNSAPMYASQYYAWQRAADAVRDYAERACGIAVDRNDHGVYCDHGRGKQRSKLYIVTGSVPTRDTVEVIGNDVNIPSMFWLAGCCVKDTGNMTSFALYMRNSPDFPVKKLPVADIEIVLAEMYRPTKSVNIKIFPGRRNGCRRSENNDIHNLHI